MKKLISVASALILPIAIGACQTPNPAPAEAPPQDGRNLSLWPESASPQAPKLDVEAQVEQLMARMSTKEKVGQLIQAEIQTLEPGDIKKYHLGSVLNGGGSLPYRKKSTVPADWVKLADELYEESMDDSDGHVAIPLIWGTDAVHGHNNLTGATIFPHNMGLGAANNPDLIEQIGRVTAREVRATGIDWVFAPTLAVARNDLWGRTYESYSEDPDIVAAYAGRMVQGLQGDVNSDAFLDNDHVVSCAKHFLADGGTFGGDDQGDARITEQELIDIHNPGYPVAIDTGVQTVMASFSSWNGEKMHGNKYLLTDVLKARMGFDGFVVGDWNGHGQVPGCTNDSCAEAINAGVDIIMVPYDWRKMYTNTLAQVQSGEISTARLDDAVRRILRVKLRTGLFEGKPSERISSEVAGSVGSPAHRAVARQAVRESLVLLKNNNGTLPIKPSQKVLVAGPGADNIPMQSGGWSITWQGTGTTNESFPGATSVYAGIRQAVVSGGGKAYLSEEGDTSMKPDVAVVVFGERPYAEGHGDRNTLEFEPGKKTSLQLLKKLKEQNIPVVAVFLSGRPLWTNPEINTADAFVAAWLPGSEGAGIADVLVAGRDGGVRHDFKGRLSFSWPASPLQTEINGPNYDTEPLFKLGYGLDYSMSRNLALLPENVPGIKGDKVEDLDFYVGRTQQPWIVYIRNHEGDQMLSGAFAELTSGDVKVQTTDKDVQEDALRFTWKDAWSAGLFMRGGDPVDLMPYLEQGVLQFDLKVNDIAKAALAVEMSCGHNCKRSVSLTDYALKNAGKGWSTLSLDLSCFKHDEDDFTAVEQPFMLGAGGTGEVDIANVRFLLKGKPNFSCPDYKTLSTTPVPQNEFWARDWWGPRHKDVVSKVKQNQYDLLMIGDSITQGWEDDGKAVWQQFYGDRNALNMGFSGDRTEHVIWRLLQGEVQGQNPDVAVLMIGTNNTGHRMEKPEYTAEGIKRIIGLLRQKLPETKILLLGVFPREAEYDAPMRVINRQVNDIIKNYADNKNVYYLNINKEFLDDSGVLHKSIMPDLLHLNEKGYRIWAQAMEPTLQKLMAE